MLSIRAAVLVALLCACGPIEYVNQVSRKADSELAAAKAVRADRYAPYYYTLAVEYLRQARREAAESDFQAANRFGRKAEEYAVRAREVAIERAARGEEPPSSDGAKSPQPDSTDDPPEDATVEEDDPLEDDEL